MALLVRADNPAELITKLHSLIDSNSIQTWSYDSDGDYTHVLDQWKNKAWIRPYKNISNHDYNLVFGFIGNKKIITSKALYGIYHGRFSEMLLTHFDDKISNIIITPMPKTSYDSITTDKD